MITMGLLRIAITAYLLVLANNSVFADDAEEKRDAFYEGFSDRRQELCYSAAHDIRRYLTGGMEGLMRYDKLTSAFCKWCKDIDKNHYRAVCPK